MSHLIPFIVRLAERSDYLIEQPHSTSIAALELFRNCTRRHVLAGIRLLRTRSTELERLNCGEKFEQIWDDLQSDCIAMFLTELLGRFWSGILEARSRRESCDPLLKNVARHVLLQHLGLRREILNLMNRWCTAAYPQVAALDFQCRRMERWTDVLLGPMVKRYALQEYVFEPERAIEYAPIEEQSEVYRRIPSARLPRKLAIAGFLKSYESSRLMVHPLLMEHQSGMIRSILGMLPDDSLFSEQRYLLGRIWSDNELQRTHAERGVKATGA